MPEHANYNAYTWNEVLEAVYGGKVDEKTNMSTNDYSLSYAEGMLDIADRIQHVQNTLLDGFYAVAAQLIYLKKHWQGPASDAFQEVNETYRQYVRDTFHSVNSPNWRMALYVAGTNLRWLRFELPKTYEAGYYTVTLPATLSGPDAGKGPQTKKHWDGERAAQAGREQLIYLVNLYHEYETHFGELPVPPKLGELPSAAADKAEEKKAFDDEKKAIEEEKQEAKEDKKKLDEDIAKEKADNKAAIDKANKENQDALDKLGEQPPPPPPPPPPPGGDLGGAPPGGDLAGAPPGGDLGGAPPGGFGEPPELPKGLAEPAVPGEPPPLPAFGGVPVPGGTDLDGDGKADLDEEGKPLPGFGEQVPGGIDISGDGKPDFDDDGNPLPGGDFSSLPSGGAPVPFLSGPPGVPNAPGAPRPGAPNLLDEPLAGNRPPGSAPGGKPFVRAPNLGLDGPDSLTPLKSGTSIPFVRSPGGVGAGVDEFGNAKLPKTGGGFGAPVDDGPNGRVGAPRGGIPGTAAGLAGFGGLGGLGSGMGAGGYPPPMGGMGGGAPGMGGQQQNGERERQTWLLEDDEIWSEDDDVTTVLGRPEDDEADEEYEVQM